MSAYYNAIVPQVAAVFVMANVELTGKAGLPDLSGRTQG